MTPAHNDRAVCAACGTGIHFIVHSQSTGGGEVEVLDSWWAHDVHPADGHDASPVGPRLGCSLVSHRDLGFCAGCAGHDRDQELLGWRALAIQQRGHVKQPWEPE